MDTYVHLGLADHAVKVGGKLYINGAGWTTRTPLPMPWALTLELRVPWDHNNRGLQFKLELLDVEGQPVLVETPEGEKPIAASGEIMLTAGPGLKPGSYISGTEAMLLPPIPLEPSQQFEFKLTLNDKTRDDWRVVFATTATPRAKAA